MGLRERRREHTVQLIVAAAAEVFGRRGYHASSMEEVAKATGCATATLYGYFPSKEALFTKVVMDLMGAYLAGVTAALAGASTFEASVHGLFEHFERFAEEQAAVIRVVHTAMRTAQLGPTTSTDEILGLIATYRAAIGPVFDRAVAEGLLAADRNHEPLYTLLLGTLHSASDAWLDVGADLRLGLHAARTLFLAGFPAVAAVLPGESS